MPRKRSSDMSLSSGISDCAFNPFRKSSIVAVPLASGKEFLSFYETAVVTLPCMISELYEIIKISQVKFKMGYYMSKLWQTAAEGS